MVAKSLSLMGKVSLAKVKDVNKGNGDMWVAALNVAAQAVQMDVSKSSAAELHSILFNTEFLVPNCQWHEDGVCPG